MLDHPRRSHPVGARRAILALPVENPPSPHGRESSQSDRIFPRQEESSLRSVPAWNLGTSRAGWSAERRALAGRGATTGFDARCPQTSARQRRAERSRLRPPLEGSWSPLRRTWLCQSVSPLSVSRDAAWSIQEWWAGMPIAWLQASATCASLPSRPVDIFFTNRRGVTSIRGAIEGGPGTGGGAGRGRLWQCRRATN